MSDFTAAEIHALKSVAKQHDSASGCVTFAVLVVAAWLACFFLLPTMLGRACSYPERTRWELAFEGGSGRECVLTTSGWVPR